MAKKKGLFDDDEDDKFAEKKPTKAPVAVKPPVAKKTNLLDNDD